MLIEHTAMDLERLAMAARDGKDDAAPLRQQLEETLRQHILDGKFAEGRLPSVRALAKEYQLSKSTVANAIAKLKQEDLLSTTHKQGVYVLNSPANRTAVRKRTGRIGVFAQGVGDLLRERIYFDAYIGMQRATVDKGYAMMYLGGDPQAETGPLQMPPGIRDIDGLIYIVGTMASERFLREVLKRNLPVVMVDSQAPRLNIDSVLIDNLDGARAVMRYLIGLGHRRIAFLNSRGQSADERLAGYREALADAGIAFDPAWVKQLLPTVDEGRSAMAEMLPLKPTAVFTFSDFQALGAMIAAEAAGLSIPGDLSFASFGNEAMGFGKNLTTVDVKMPELGALATGLLFERIRGQVEHPQTIRVKTRLIVGGTTAAPKA